MKRKSLALQIRRVKECDQSRAGAGPKNQPDRINFAGPFDRRSAVLQELQQPGNFGNTGFFARKINRQ